MNTTDSSSDQLAVRRAIEKYFDAVNRRRSDDIMALWADDCHWSVPDIPGLEQVSGKAAIREHFEAAQAMFPVVFVVGMVGDIQVKGDAATARVYTTEVLENIDGSVRNAVGRYDDELVRLEGRWYFRQRTWRMTYQQ